MATIQVPDHIYDAIKTQADARNVPAETLIAQLLEKFKAALPGQRMIPLGEAALTAIEARTGGAQLRTTADVVTAVQTLASISFAGVHLPLTPGQLRELETRAAREHKPVERYVAEVVAGLTETLMNSAGAGRPDFARLPSPAPRYPLAARTTPDAHDPRAHDDGGVLDGTT